MKAIFFMADIIFFELSKESFRFPLINSVRTSLWLANTESSTFSEIQIKDEQVEIWKIHNVKIMLIERDFLKDKIKCGIEFKLGTYPKEIAYGRVTNLVE